MIIEIQTENIYQINLEEIIWMTPVIYDEFKEKYCIELKTEILEIKNKYIYSNSKELLQKKLQYIKDCFYKNYNIVFPELKKCKGNFICDFQLPIDFLQKGKICLRDGIEKRY